MKKEIKTIEIEVSSEEYYLIRDSLIVYKTQKTLTCETVKKERQKLADKMLLEMKI